ncbi:MAG: hypothetical protein ACOCPQ_04305, partial [Desulfosudaceae bacterium]
PGLRRGDTIREIPTFYEAINFNLLYYVKIPDFFVTGPALFVRFTISYAVPEVTISQGIFAPIFAGILTFFRQVSF